MLETGDTDLCCLGSSPIALHEYDARLEGDIFWGAWQVPLADSLQRTPACHCKLKDMDLKMQFSEISWHTVREIREHVEHVSFWNSGLIFSKSNRAFVK